MGTPDYAAPEQYEADPDIDHRADIYSLGVMMYQMLTGKLPRGAYKAASDRVPQLDPRIDAILVKAMEHDRADRYQSVAEIRRDWDKIMAGRTAAVPASVGAAVTPKKTTTQAAPRAKSSSGRKPSSQTAAKRSGSVHESHRPSSSAHRKRKRGEKDARFLMIAAGAAVLLALFGFAISKLWHSRNAEVPHAAAPVTPPESELPSEDSESESEPAASPPVVAAGAERDGTLPSVLEYEGHLYAKVKIVLSYDEARKRARSMGGDLASLTTAEEQEWVIKNFMGGDTYAFWIGGYRDVNGPWKWVTGELMSFAGWFSHPDGQGIPKEDENFIQLWAMQTISLWRAVPRESKAFFLVEWSNLDAVPRIGAAKSPSSKPSVAPSVALNSAKPPPKSFIASGAAAVKRPVPSAAELVPEFRVRLANYQKTRAAACGHAGLRLSERRAACTRGGGSQRCAGSRERDQC